MKELTTLNGKQWERIQAELWEWCDSDVPADISAMAALAAVPSLARRGGAHVPVSPGILDEVERMAERIGGQRRMMEDAAARGISIKRAELPPIGAGGAVTASQLRAYVDAAREPRRMETMSLYG